MLDGKKYYQKKSLNHKRYKFSSKAKLAKGQRPIFFALIKKYSNKNLIALDLGCGSGELTLKLSPYFKKVIGIDPVEQYIKTAKQDKKTKHIKNVNFIIASGDKLPFHSKTFDLIISSRGPLSSGLAFLKEAKRVLKKDGFLVEETIGEKDKIELKKIFKRGQSYPIVSTKLNKIKEILSQEKFVMIYHRYYSYSQNYKTMKGVVNILNRAPIIPNFDINRDNDKLKLLKDKLFTKNGIILSSHRLHWIARNK